MPDPARKTRPRELGRIDATLPRCKACSSVELKYAGHTKTTRDAFGYTKSQRVECQACGKRWWVDWS